ncbi:integrator complex subunit 7 [Solea senegalensis]|uniref:Integrator complex subunit 7 n=2 Tax=Solea senegalensis TaxID=28829 RepID=A0AAV6RUL3_SOLSE|nr:integrator complex subunit 7 [Solea senegalensis]
MSLSTARSFLSEACYGEQELDANSALMELDKGLRSGKLGEQCEAVVLFPKLFQKYPFPILINSAFLKLADIFRLGNNFLRLCVLKVTQQSEKHLEKILNVDEFVKRVFSVIHSNDPVARAITLRMLGSLASIIPERKNAHHSIRQSLDSHDNVEVEAAIFAAASFSAQSKDFAAGICNKVSEMIQGLDTPVELKLKLIPMLQHMHHDASLASSSRELLQQLVNSYPSTPMVIVTLHTFTQLAAFSLIDIPKQLQLLLQYLKDDPRRAVKRLAINDLKLLAKKAPHLWIKENTQALCECALTSPYISLKLGMLAVLSTLSGTIAIKQYFSNMTGASSVPPRHTDLVKLAQECCYHSNLAVAAHGVIVLSNIAISCPENDIIQLEQDTVLAVQSLLMLCSQDNSPSAQATLKTALTSLVQMLKSRPHLSQSAVEFLLGQLHLSCDSSRVLMCHALAAIATHMPVLGDGMLGDLVDLYRVASHSSTDKQQELLVSLATVIFVASQSSLSADVKTVIKQQLENVANGWTVYCIARQASRMGCHEFSSELYQSLRTRVASEHFYFWLNSLKEFSQAEQCLSHVEDGDYSGAMSAIAEALRSYQKGIASLTAASTPLSPLTFQCDFIKLRIDTLQALSQLICTCNSLKTSPPPAIATTIALTSGNELQRCGRISLQMNVCMDEFRSLAARYADLHQSSFDADYATLRNVELQQQSCLLISHVIEALILDPQAASFQEYGTLGTVQTESEYERRMMSVFNHVLEEVEGLTKKHPPVSHLHTGCLCDAVIALLKVPLSFQRYFFQKLQSTSIKLAISPSPRTPSEPIPVQSSQQLTLKVEGVVQHGSTPGLFRKIQSVCLNVTSVLQSKTGSDFKVPLDTKTNEIEQRVEPHNDYFSTQFLLNFSILGTHSVTVEASVVDESGTEWKTGPKTTVLQHIPCTALGCYSDVNGTVCIRMAQLLDEASKLGWVLLRAVIRFVFMFINNCVAIPSYCLYLILLQPLRIWDSSTFWHIEGVMFKWLLAMVSSWGWIAGYTVTEWGDDVRPISEEEAMVIVNHQSTGDVCTLMMCLQDKGTVVRKMMWLMDHVFKYTNFGLVSLIHGDFFIRQGKAHRDKQLVYLKDHLEKYYHSRDRKWIVLFPEGGFLRKRRETSQLFAKKNSLPHLTHVTLPRLGATHIILKTLAAQQENGSVAMESLTSNQIGNKRTCLQWVIDVTIAYPKARPMDIQTWIFGYRPPTVTHVHYRMYPIKEVPVEAEALTDWLYQRFVEKEKLLTHFYDTGSFPPLEGHKVAVSRQMTLDPVWLCVIQSFAFVSGYVWYNVLQYLYCCLF